MKRKVIAMLSLVVATLVGCGGVSQTSFDSVVAEAEPVKGTLSNTWNKLFVSESKSFAAESR